MKKTIILLLFSMVLLSCETDNTERTISYENKYSLAIPAFLTEVHNLNDEASLQYQHAWKEFYVIVIDEPKSELQGALDTYNLSNSYTNNLDGYSKLILDNFNLGDLNLGYSNIEDTIINKMPAKLLSFSQSIDDTDIYFEVALIEGIESYYQVMAWTSEEKKYFYKDKMNDILFSLKEL